MAPAARCRRACLHPRGGKADIMEKEHQAQRELHAELLELIRPEAPGGWIIVLIKAELAGPEGEVSVDHVDSTGHVLWHENGVELRRAVYRALWRYRGSAGAEWSRASLVLSEEKLLSADFR